jgi:phosphoribosylamine--glycine ligase
MNVLVVGNGAREHAIAWKLSQSPGIGRLLVAPGNAGTEQIAENIPVDAIDVDGLLRLAQERRIDLTVVGPEAPLAAGIADRFQAAGLLAFGPTKAAARIETSKSFAKALMLRHGVPTGGAETFSSYEEAQDYINSAVMPVVVKADGLAAGKGVTIAHTREKALSATRRQMVERQFGQAGERVLIEEYLEGKEISVFAFVDGRRVSSLVAARDYKRAGDGDTGPNTGGMGSYSPPERSIWNGDVERRVRSEIMEPVVRALADEGTPYRGVLYAGLMLTADGPKVLEFNCRLGDPETQAILPRLKSDLLDVMLKTARGDIGDLVLELDSRACVGVVLASGGYPDGYRTGYPVHGLDTVEPGSLVFHAGTKTDDNDGGEPGRVLTDGGRVLTVAALGATRSEARAGAYAGAGRISFTDSFYRVDIASS